jgi:acetyl-CoA C-acetyltransferase
MISYPYPKYLNAVMNTEQSAAVLMCSTDMAKRLGVPEHQWVYWRGGAKARETEWFPSDRPSFTESEAMGLAAKNALANADCLVDEISAFDFYSCFPIAVEIACKQLGIAEDDSRDFTVTGGLPYAGGPASNYSLHGVAAMMQRLRKNNSSSHDSSENANQDHTGLVTGNGWYMTKHAAAVLSTLPPVATNTDIDDIRIAQENQSASMAAIPDHAKATLAADDINATVEAYTVTFDRDGKPSRGIVVGSTEQGQRFVANTADDRDLLESFCAVEQVGTKGKVTSASGKNLFDPH